jgi:hypothetical protein
MMRHHRWLLRHVVVFFFVFIVGTLMRRGLGLGSGVGPRVLKCGASNCTPVRYLSLLYTMPVPVQNRATSIFGRCHFDRLPKLRDAE